ncbi:MAG: N-acetyltransferase [Methanoregula sp.]
MDSFFIRPEIPEDIPAIFEVNYQAFAHEDEARLVDTLRDAKIFNPELSLVAVHGDRIIGHIMFPPITIESSRAIIPAIALAPLVVHPDYQCLGVGAALIEEGLNACRKFGHRIVIVIGHPGYYPRYGFHPARDNGIEAPFTVDDKVFMVLALDHGALDGVEGMVKYPAAFDAIVGSGMHKNKKVVSLS